MRVALTRPAERGERLSEALREAGFIVVECPLIRIEPLDGPSIDPSGYDWVVLTSRTAVDLLFARLAGELPRVAVIGPGTAEALRAQGWEPSLVASVSTQEGLLAELPRPTGRVLIPAAEGARPMLAAALDADVVALYRAVEERPEGFPECDLVVLASASAASSFAALRLDRPCVSIGPVTSETARSLGVEVIAEARNHDLEGLVDAVRSAAARL